MNRASIDIIAKKTTIMTEWTSSAVGELMASNPYEKLAPFRVWFRSEAYQVECAHDVEANQKLRVRFWKGVLLTPLFPHHGEINVHLAKMLPNLSLYQPYYPESYYDLWELLSDHPDLLPGSTARVGAWVREWQTGALEAIILFLESKIADLSQMVFHCHSLERSPVIEYLAQTLPVSEPRDDLAYHLLYFGGLDQMDTPSDWHQMEREMTRYPKIITQGMELLEEGGAIIVYLRRSWCEMDHPLWGCLVSFAQVQFWRPSISNRADPVTYLLATGYQRSRQIQKPRAIARAWRSRVGEPIPDYPEGRLLLEQWHLAHHDLPMITRPTSTSQQSISYFVRAPSDLHRTGSGLALDADVQQRMDQYAIKLRGQKRVMDTKPSTAHAPSLPSRKREITYRDWDWNHSEKRAFQQLKQHVQRTFRAEVVTNAWLKMYETWSSIPELRSMDRINAFHICEAPGAFVAATNHFAYSNEIPYTWRAQTLVAPSSDDLTSATLVGCSATALGDHFGMIAAYPDWWLQGPDACYGDITRPETIRYYRSHPDLQKINWISSDAGKQCEVNRLCSQETIGLDLVLGQVACILACLQPGGHAIYKTFLPLTEEINLSMLALVSRSFQGCKIYKPYSSTSSNSEVYVVLTNYHGPDEQVIEQLLLALKIGHRKGWDHLPAPFQTRDPTFFNYLLMAVSSLVDHQIASLQNIYYRYYLSDEPSRHRGRGTVPDYRAEQWKKICRPKPLPLVNKLLVKRR